jgi:nicotinamide-nucleotide amidase
MFPPDLLARAEKLLAGARAGGLKIVTAESCTGGLVAGLLTEIAGSSDVFERGFVTYSNQAKQDLLGVPASLLAKDGAVSASVARAMVEGALAHSQAHIAVSITGIAGPGGGTATKPVGTVYVACCARPTIDSSLDEVEIEVSKCEFGDIGRSQIRLKSVKVALSMIEHLL